MNHWLRLPLSVLAASVTGALIYVSFAYLTSPLLFGIYEPMDAFFAQVQLWSVIGLMGTLLFVVPTAIVCWKKKVRKSRAVIATFSSCVVTNVFLFFGLGGFVNASLWGIIMSGVIPGVIGGIAFICFQYLTCSSTGRAQTTARAG